MFEKLKNNNGNILIFALLASSVLILIGSSLARLCFINAKITEERFNEGRVFYFAEAGLEMAKSKINKNNEYFTDNFVSLIDKKYLLFGAKGEIFLFEDGGFKIVIQKGKNIIYSVGFLGEAILSGPAYAFLKKNINLKKSEISQKYIR